jgi:hypothetical protein
MRSCVSSSAVVLGSTPHHGQLAHGQLRLAAQPQNRMGVRFAAEQHVFGELFKQLSPRRRKPTILEPAQQVEGAAVVAVATGGHPPAVPGDGQRETRLSGRRALGRTVG